MQLAVTESLADNKCLHLTLAEKGKHILSLGALQKLRANNIPTIDFVDNWVWIGLQRRGETNFTKWINNAPLNYTEYLPGQPEPGLWEAEKCTLTW